jgi:hypothetical protein
MGKESVTHVRGTASNFSCGELRLTLRRILSLSTSLFQVEDMFLTKRLYDHPSKYGHAVPATSDAAWWSQETPRDLWNDMEPYFIHRAWDYQPADKWALWMMKAITYYPELWKKEEPELIKQIEAKSP